MKRKPKKNSSSFDKKKKAKKSKERAKSKVTEELEELEMRVVGIKKELKDMAALTEMVLFDIKDSEAKLSYLRLATAQERFRISKKHKPEREYVA
jgi:hypothetical protein